MSAHNALNTTLQQAIESVHEAKSTYKRTRNSHVEASRTTDQQCSRLASMQKIAKTCAAAMKTCRRRQIGISHLIEKRNRLRAELQALQSTKDRMKRLEQVLDEEDYDWEGEFVGRGKYQGYRVTVTDNDAGFTVASSRVGTAEDQLGVKQSFAMGQIGEALRFCLSSNNSQTCGKARVDANGFEFDGVKFSKV